MRPDFKYLLTERERHNSRWVKPNQGEGRFRQKEECNLEYEDWAPGTKVSIKRNPFGTSRTTKSLSENLTPLTNYLRSKVGEKWDDVFSEISETCPNDSAVSGHIYSHLWQFVVRNPLFKGEKIYDGDNLLQSIQVSPKFYVHPETNVLTEAPRGSTKRSRREARKAEKSDIRALPNKNFAFKIKGIWHEGAMVAIPPPICHEVFGGVYYTYPEFYDAIIMKERGYMYTYLPQQYNYFVRELQRRYNGRKIFCNGLQQMNTGQLKNFKLVNDKTP